MADEQRIGIVVRRARERKRWTQKDLAKALGVSRTTVDAWENDRTRPRNRTGALEDVLGIRLNGSSPQPGPLADLEPFDDWEQHDVIDDPRLSVEDKRELITWSRGERAEAVRRRREARAAERPGTARSDRRSQAG